MKYSDWIDQVPQDIKHDAVWSVKVYRISLFLSDLSWNDIKPISEQNLFSLSDQLYRSVGSISANITEGYSRNSFKEQARFYEIALGSTRESKDWYFKCLHVLSNKVSYHRIKILTSISRLLLAMINERRILNNVEEPNVNYTSSLDHLLERIPE